MCSTPFGIKDCCTSPLRVIHGPRDLVLNAFRHQRLLHTAQAVQKGWRRRVLNAFRHQRLLHRRLRVSAHGGQQVLNAFRHQRLLHVQIQPQEDIHHVVLNAFRHQRLLHSTTRSTVHGNSRCSTPFGIKDCCTHVSFDKSLVQSKCSTPFGIKDCCTNSQMDGAHHPAAKQVLNAFRHQRLLHRLPRGRGEMPLMSLVLNAFRHQRLLHQRQSEIALQRHFKMCSTPFGIKDCCTPGLIREIWCDVLRGAQRLSASKIAAQGSTLASAHTRRSRGAQRLSASKIAALGRKGSEMTKPIYYYVLNAFRHQRLLHAPR